MPRNFNFSEDALDILPVIYVAWADADLTPAEISTIRRTIEASKLSDDTRRLVSEWLDPNSPPDAHELVTLLGTIAELMQDAGPSANASLPDLSRSMSRSNSAESLEAVADLERATKLNADLLLRDLYPEKGEVRPNSLDDNVAGGLEQLLNDRWRIVRQKVFETLQHEQFAREAGDQANYRELTLKRVRLLSDAGLGLLAYPASVGGGDDLDQAIGGFEALALGDLSTLVKFGVQFGLFGGSILQLGTAKHHERYLHAVGTLDIPGCFAMTERGHGSNVRDIQTTATFEPDTGGFVINSPGREAAKEWIGNAAAHGRMATVFARLVIQGRDYGIHAFLVPLRNERGEVVTGVSIEDMGDKIGLNLVDNGRIMFDNKAVPREALLDRFSSVSRDGVYSSPIRSSSARFFTMIGTLVTGRISVARAALSTAKKALLIAVRYAEHRRQFGPAGRPEIPLLDYQTHQLRLMPAVAASYCLHFALDELCDRTRHSDSETRKQIETLAAALKAYTTDFNTTTVQTCRESCGGRGYNAAMGFGDLRNDTDVFTTFEGDNTVLYQLVARGLLTEFKEQFGDVSLGSIWRLLSERASTRLSEMNPVITRKTSAEHLQSREFHLGALEFRYERLRASLARRLQSRLREGMDPFDAVVECQDHMIHLARSYAEYVIADGAWQRATDSPDLIRPFLESAVQLYALDCMYRDRAWFLESGYMEPAKTRAIRSLRARLCGEMRPHALTLVAGFGIPDFLYTAPEAI